MTERWVFAFPRLGMISNEGQVEPLGGRVVFLEPSGMSGGRVGCLDARTGRLLWRTGQKDELAERIAVGGGKVVAVRRQSLAELDVKTGRTRWSLPVERYHFGPVLYGSTVVAEVKAGALRAYDLQTHTLKWKLDYPAEFQGYTRNGASAVSGNDLWLEAADGNVVRVSLSSGKLLSKQRFGGGHLAQIVPIGDGVAIVGAEETLAWRGADGTPVWRSTTMARGHVAYMPALRELWTFPMMGEALYRYGAKDGKAHGGAVPLGNRGGLSGEPVPFEKGYLLSTSDGVLHLDAAGNSIGFYDAGESLTNVQPLGRDFLLWSSDRLVRLERGAPPRPKDPLALARKLVAKPDLTVTDRVSLERLGRAAVPTIVEALKKPAGGDRDTLLFVLLRVAKRPDTPLIFPLADAAHTFVGESSFANRDYRSWMETEADPEWLAPRLLPRLRSARKEADQERLAQYLVRSRNDEVVAELLKRLQSEQTSIWVKDTIYHGIGGSGNARARAEILRLRRDGPTPKWKGSIPPAPQSETQRVLAAVFDARMRFYRPRVEQFNLGYGRGVKPFAVVGWPLALAPVENPLDREPGPTSKIEMPYIIFEPMDANGTMVRFDSNGTSAVARIGVMIAPLYGLGYEAKLRKIDGDWFVTSMSETWIS